MFTIIYKSQGRKPLHKQAINMIQEYINYLRNLRGYAENTALSYERDLKDFVIWVRKNIPGATWSSLTIEDIDRYIMAMATAGLKPATTNRRLSAISGLYNFMRREGYDVENPCHYEHRRKIGKSIPNTIPANDLRAAYDHAVGATKIMLGLLITTGIRIQELLDITWEDIDFEKQSIKITGKGNKQRVVYTQAPQLETLRLLKEQQALSGKIFTIEQRVARRMIWEALKPYSSARQLSPHAIRHTYATQLATMGVNVTTLAKILGHDRIATTQHYIDMTQTDTRSVMTNNNIIN